MSLTRADREALLGTLNHLLDPASRAILAAHLKLAPWIPDLETHQRDLAAPAPPPPPERPALRPLDHSVEELLRALRESLRAAARWRRHRGDADLARQLDALHDALYPDGLAPLTRPLPAQAAATDRLLLLARTPEHADALAATSISGDPAADLLTALEEANAALKTALAAPTATLASDYAQQRNAAISTLSQLRTLIERNLDGADRAHLLKAFG
jgi:hypothetical protein